MIWIGYIEEKVQTSNPRPGDRRPSMDSVFQLSPVARNKFLRNTARAIGCSYISLWSYRSHPSPRLVSTDAWLHGSCDDGDGDGGELSSANRHLFHEYFKSACIVGNSTCVPGFAYEIRTTPYVELHGSDLLQRATFLVQTQFYQEAGIKSAVFMGCNSGVIEVGMSMTGIKIDKKVSMMSYFTEEAVAVSSYGLLMAEQSCCLPSSSSSSIPSFSTSSPECSSFLRRNSIASTSSTPPPDALISQEACFLQHAVDHPIPSQSNEVVSFGKNGQPHGRLSEAQFSWQTTNLDDTMTRAMIAVLSSSSSSLSSHSSHLPTTINSRQRQQWGNKSYREIAFRPYRSGGNLVGKRHCSSGSQSLLRRMHALLKNTDLNKARESLQEQGKATSNQLHHMISERKRREKLNESFQSLRSLLPPGTKKDKASVLATAKDYVNHLKSQMTHLEAKNRELELQQLLPTGEEQQQLEMPSDDTVMIQVTQVSDSSASLEMQSIELKVAKRGECDVLDMMLNVLQCIKEMGNIDITSMEANHCAGSIKRATFTLRIREQEGDWDGGTFKEAIRRAIVHDGRQAGFSSLR